MAIRAGQRILALDFAGYSAQWDGGNETNFNTTSYTAGTTPIGVTFVAPTGGAVMVHWHASATLNDPAGGLVFVSTEVREGSTIGSGTVVLSPSDDVAMAVGGSSGVTRSQAAMLRDATGLTPGATYNARVLHRNQLSAASAGSLFARSIYTTPLHL